jgi:hypothetical protein
VWQILQRALPPWIFCNAGALVGCEESRQYEKKQQDDGNGIASN